MNDIPKAHEPWCETRLVCDSCPLCPHSDTAKCDCGVETIPPMQAPTPNSHDEQAIALLRRIEPHIDAIVCYASTMDEHEPNRLAVDLREYLATHPSPISVEGEREAFTNAALEWAAACVMQQPLDVCGALLDKAYAFAARTSPASDIMQGAREAAAYAGTRIHCPSGHTYKAPEALCPHCTSPGLSIGEGELVEQVELAFCIEEVPHIKGYGFEDYRRVYPELAYRAHSHAKAIARALIATGCIRLKEGA